MPKETLKDLVVTPENIANGFFHPELYYKYLEITRAAEQGKTFIDLCSEKGFSRSRPSDGYDHLRGQFRSWVQHGRIPYPVQSVLALQEMGFFPEKEGSFSPNSQSALIHDTVQPFDYQNPRFPLANLLASCAFWRGSLNEHNVHSGFDVSMNPKEDLPSLRRMVNILIKGVNLSPKKRKLRLDSFYGRFLEALGFPTDKTVANMAFPRPFELASSSLDAGSGATDEEIDAARNTVRDFVLAAFYMGRICKPPENPYHLSLPSSSDREIADQRCILFDGAFQKARLDIARRILSVSAKTSSGNDFVFPGMDQFDVDRLVTEFEGRIAQIINSLES